MDYREPCPWRVTDDCGGAFALGVIGGSIFNVIKGFKNAPALGFAKRARTALTEARLQSPRTGGSFAAWGLTFSSCDCALIYMRGKEDPINSILSGGVTGAVLAFRGGPGQMFLSGLIGAVLLAAIEGVSIGITHYTAGQFHEANFQALTPPSDPSQLGSLPEQQVPM